MSSGYISAAISKYKLPFDRSGCRKLRALPRCERRLSPD